MSESVLPPPPRQPDESECCNSDCVLCVKDIYEQELKIWKQECQDILLKNVGTSHQPSIFIYYHTLLRDDLISCR